MNYLLQEISKLQQRVRNQSMMLDKMQRKYRTVKGDLAVKNKLIADMIVERNMAALEPPNQESAGREGT